MVLIVLIIYYNSMKVAREIQSARRKINIPNAEFKRKKNTGGGGL